MKTIHAYLTLVALLATPSVQAQTAAPQTEDEYTKQTALLKAQQAYYDQVLLTAKSQQAAAEASVAVQTASVTAATQLQAAQYNSDLALATAIKGSGLSAATGKDGSITIAAAEKTLLALQRDSLQVIDTLSTSVCSEIAAKLPPGPDGKPLQAFIAPANYESLVEKSVTDIIQLASLHDAAINGTKEFESAHMEVAAAALAGALVSGQYLAGGVQGLTKLFRTDYNLSFTPTNRQGLFEQTLGGTCRDVVLSNVEGKLRLGAAKVLYKWLPDMAKFSELYDMWSERATQRKTQLTARRTEIAGQQPTTEKAKTEQKAILKEIDASLKDLSGQEEKLAKYKQVASSIKTYLSAIGSGSLYDSLVWGQQYLHTYGGLPTDVKDLQLEKRPRLSYTLNVQDVNIKSSSTFSSDKVRYFATAEIYYLLVSAEGDPLAVGVHSTRDALNKSAFDEKCPPTSDKPEQRSNPS